MGQRGIEADEAGLLVDRGALDDRDGVPREALRTISGSVQNVHLG